jgi:hypothetical protein
MLDPFRTYVGEYPTVHSKNIIPRFCEKLKTPRQLQKLLLFFSGAEGMVVVLLDVVVIITRPSVFRADLGFMLYHLFLWTAGFALLRNIAKFLLSRYNIP